MKLGRLIFSGMVTAAMFAGSADAAPRDKPADDSSVFGTVPEAEALAKAHRYAVCLVQKRPNVVREALALDFQSEAYGKRMHDIAEGKNNCTRVGRMQVSPILFSAALAEAAFKHDFGSRDMTSVIPSDWTANPVKARSESEVAALCLVQRDPLSARALLDTDPASESEKASLGKLATLLPNCLTQGMTFRLNRPALRAIVSLALYRSARHFAGQGV